MAKKATGLNPDEHIGVTPWTFEPWGALL